MKIILTILILTNTAIAGFDCNNIDSTMSLVSSGGCGNTKFCVGYAECNSPKGKYIGRIICKADKNLNCPSANECLDEVFEKKTVEVAILPGKDPRGVFRFCNSPKTLKPLRQNKTDVVNSRFCDLVSGEYDKARQQTIQTMTGKEGGGGQMTTAK